MPVKYPCLLWVAFFFLDIPPAVPLVCAVKLRPSVRRWRFCAHHQEEEGGRMRGGGGGGGGVVERVGISQRRSVRLDAAQLTSQQEHTCAFLPDPGRQAGGASVSQSASPLSSTERRRKSPQLL